MLLLTLLLCVRWNPVDDYKMYDSLDTFTVVELRLPDMQTQPDIDVSPTKPTEEAHIEKEKPLSFGSSDGEYNDLTEGAIPPRAVFSRLPVYPDSMRKAGIEGIVVIELGIDEAGNVTYGRIIQSLGKVFDAAVISWAGKIRFAPARDPDKRPIRCRIRVPIRFRLEN